MPSNFLTKSLLPKTNSSPSYRKSCVILAVRNRDQSFFCTISGFCRIILAGVWLNTSYIHILNHMIHWLQQSYRSSYVAHSKKHACQSVSHDPDAMRLPKERMLGMFGTCVSAPVRLLKKVQLREATVLSHFLEV